MKKYILYTGIIFLLLNIFLIICCDLYFPPTSFTGPFTEPTPHPTYGPVPSLVPTPSVPPDGEMIYNNDFSNGMASWTLFVHTAAGADASVEAIAEEAVITITEGVDTHWYVQLIQNYLLIEQQKTYALSFDAWATEGVSRDISIEIGENGRDNNEDGNNYTAYTWQTITLPTSQPEPPFSWEFTMTETTDDYARLVFNLGADNNNVIIDNVSLKEVVP